MKALITGITGFVGSHMAEFLLNRNDIEVWGIDRWRSNKENIKHIEDKINLVECDLRDASSVESTVKRIKPEKIFHLAAQSFVPTSWNAPAETMITNVIGELNLFEAVRNAGINPWIQIAGSSEEYGMVYPNETPIKETNPLRPLSPYGVSKVGQDMLGYQYAMSYKMKIIRTRGFNHTGPRRGEVFVESNFAQQIAKIEKGKQKPVMRVGNLDARRDYTDVRDMVRAYWLSTEKCEPGEVYNICSGIDYTIKSVLDTLLSFSNIKVEIKQDPARMRPSDVEILLGDNTKFRNATGWNPEIPFKQTLEDLLNYWRTRV
jgi:GDP-4-dehydro-6-deoxy-D-mannose reductase